MAGRHPVVREWVRVIGGARPHGTVCGGEEQQREALVVERATLRADARALEHRLQAPRVRRRALPGYTIRFITSKYLIVHW